MHLKNFKNIIHLFFCHIFSLIFIKTFPIYHPLFFYLFILYRFLLILLADKIFLINFARHVQNLNYYFISIL